MKDNYFINIAFDTAIRNFLEAQELKGDLLYYSFLVVVVRALSLIYGEKNILNPYYLKNSVALINNLSKYGVSSTDIVTFFEELDLYYKLEKKNEQETFKQKNPHFTNVQKYLIDMFIMKKNNTSVNYEEESEFLELLYTSHTKNVYQISYNYLVSEDPNFIEKYYYSRLNEHDITRVDLASTISKSINLDALAFMGINLSNIHSFSESEIMDVQDNAYKYFQIDTESPNRNEELKRVMDYYNIYGKKVTSGNGYVDILLLMSVIVTSLSIIAIILFNL